MDKQVKTYWDQEDFSTPYQMGAQKHRLYILDKLKELGVNSLLDEGCGTGPIYDLIINSEEGRWDNIRRYRGTDYSWRMIDTCRSLFSNGDFKIEDARHLDEPDSTWDCVLLMHCMDHLDDYASAIKEAVRVSKKYVAFIFWTGFVNEGTTLNSKNVLIKEFDKYGLIDIDIAEIPDDYSKYNYIWILRKP